MSASWPRVSPVYWLSIELGMTKRKVLGDEASSVPDRRHEHGDGQRQLEGHNTDGSLGPAEAGSEELRPRI